LNKTRALNDWPFGREEVQKAGEEYRITRRVLGTVNRILQEERIGVD
jgi:hypothetical protein